VREECLKRPDLAYDDAKTKSRPHLVLMPAAPATPKAEKPAPKVEEAASAPVKEAPKAEPPAPKAKKAKKIKAANNDDPS
jgi:hypothetical protein